MGQSLPDLWAFEEFITLEQACWLPYFSCCNDLNHPIKRWRKPFCWLRSAKNSLKRGVKWVVYHCPNGAKQQLKANLVVPPDGTKTHRSIAQSLLSFILKNSGRGSISSAGIAVSGAFLSVKRRLWFSYHVLLGEL